MEVEKGFKMVKDGIIYLGVVALVVGVVHMGVAGSERGHCRFLNELLVAVFVLLVQ